MCSLSHLLEDLHLLMYIPRFIEMIANCSVRNYGMNEELAIGWEISRGGYIFAKDFSAEQIALSIAKVFDVLFIENTGSQIMVNICSNKLLVIHCWPDKIHKPGKHYGLLNTSLWNPDLDDDDYPIAECELTNGQVDEYPIYNAVERSVGIAAIKAFVYDEFLSFDQGWRIYSYEAKSYLDQRF
jgi:hypothetical protein